MSRSWLIAVLMLALSSCKTDLELRMKEGFFVGQCGCPKDCSLLIEKNQIRCAPELDYWTNSPNYGKPINPHAKCD